MHRPSFYAERFFKFMSSTVFRKSSCEHHLWGRDKGRGVPAWGWGKSEPSQANSSEPQSAGLGPDGPHVPSSHRPSSRTLGGTGRQACPQPPAQS